MCAPVWPAAGMNLNEPSALDDTAPLAGWVTELTTMPAPTSLMSRPLAARTVNGTSWQTKPPPDAHAVGPGV